MALASKTGALAVNCPRCAGELRTWRQDLVAHHYCPRCQPGYTDPPTNVERVTTMLFMLGALALYPIAWLYLRWRHEL